MIRVLWQWRQLLQDKLQTFTKTQKSVEICFDERAMLTSFGGDMLLTMHTYKQWQH